MLQNHCPLLRDGLKLGMEASRVYFRVCPWQTDGQSADNGFGEGESGAARHSAVEPREVEYSDIDFSRWNRNGPAGGEHTQGAAETEYAELQKDGNRQEPEENSGDSEEDVAVAIDEEETEQWMSMKGAGPGRKRVTYSNANAKKTEDIDCLKAWEGG